MIVKTDKQLININKIQNLIYNIRGQQVMLDRDLAEMYQVPIKRLNEQVKRNKKRFPEKFCFQLAKEEVENLEQNLRSQIATLKIKQGEHRKYLPYVFTEQGVAMLSAILRSDVAIHVSIQIMDAFVQMRKFLMTNANLFQRLEQVEIKQLENKIKTDQKINQIFQMIESNNIIPKKGIFYNGQVFDAHKLISKLIKSAKREIVLIDNFIDENVLELFLKRKKKVKLTIYTKKISKTLQTDLQKFNQQYPEKKIKIKEFQKAHDRFLIIDQNTIYHFGASLKDLGKKWFAFSKFEKDGVEMIKKLR